MIPAGLAPFSDRFAQTNAFATYTDNSIHGDTAAYFVGTPTYSFHRYILTGSHHVLRGYVKKTSTPTGHAHILQAVTSADVIVSFLQVRNDAGNPLRHTSQTPFVTFGTTAAWAVDTVWRIEYDIVNAGAASTATAKIWTDPESNGTPTYTYTGTTGVNTYAVKIGNMHGQGLQVVWDTFAVSDGEAIGPVTMDPVDGGVSTAMLWNGADWVESGAIKSYNEGWI